MKKLILLFSVLCCSLSMWAYSFSSEGIYYSITSSVSPFKVSVTYANTNYNSYSGSVTIPSSVSYNGTAYAVTSIGDNAFYYSSSLTSVLIPSSITSIGSYSFNHCNKLASVTIPSSVTSIGNYAFNECSGLTSIHANNSTPVSITLGSNIFSGVSASACKLYVPTGSGDLYGAASQWSAFTTRLTENLTPSVSINASATTVCSGTSVTFTAIPSNGGTAPTYQWKKNGTAISGATGSVYTTTNFADKDTISCVLTSNLSYVSPQTATGNLVAMTVLSGSVIPAVSVSATATAICSGNSVAFTATPVNGGATPGYQWMLNNHNISGATGNTYTTSALSNNDSINCVMTSGLSCASPATATSNYVKVQVGSLKPSVAISSTATSICSGSSVTFTATPVNGGYSPGYQWRKNGNNIYGETSSTYTTTGLNDKDSVSCVMTSSLSSPCVITPTANSNGIKMSVATGTVTPSVTINATATSICPGTAVTFTAVPTYGGSKPVYQWRKNGAVIKDAINSTYTTTTLNDKDSIGCNLTSNLTCVTSATVSSPVLKMSVGNLVPSVSIQASATTTCSGSSVTFTATPVNGGAKPSYQWRKNGAAISGATSSTYTTTTLSDKDSVSCVLTSNLECVTTTTVYSNQIKMTVITGTVTPSLTISASTTTTCSGIPITFTAMPTNGGSNPTFQWKKNGVAILGATTSTYTTTALSNSDAITCVMTPSLSCVTATTVTSNTIMMSVSNSFAMDGVYYSIMSFDNKTVSVTYINTNYNSYFGYNGYSGSITIPSTVTYNGITYAVTSIGSNAFYNSSSLTSVSIPSSITSIGSYAFYDCNKLTSLTIPSSVTSIGSYAFNSCSGLTSIHANNSTPVSITLGSNIFSGVSTSGCKLYVPTGSGELYGSASQWSAFTTRLTENLTPSVSINASATTVCSGTLVTFTATPSNGGIAPTYQWKKNRVSISGATGNVYTTMALADKDTISCDLTSSLSYVTTKTASSDFIMMSVIAGTVTPSVTVSATTTAICPGSSVTFTATPVNGGSTPSYQWKCNESIISGAISSTYATSALSNNDSISCIMTSGLSCASPSTTTGNYIKVLVGSLTPSVAISATATAICSGTSVTFTATPVNGGFSPSYQWRKNGNDIYGETSNTYTTTTLNDQDSVNCVMTSNMSCVTTTKAISGFLKMSVATGTVTPSVTINATATSICKGTAVTFTAVPTYGGSKPVYQWRKNGAVIKDAINSTYTTTTLNDKDSIGCDLTSNLTCVTSATVSSPVLKMSVGNLIPSVSIQASATTTCSGSSVTFTATPVNGGAKPSYQWRKNGAEISGATRSIYTTTTLSDKDSVSCVLTSNLECVTTTTVYSNQIKMTVITGTVTPLLTISASTTTTCSGIPITFTAMPTNGGSNPTFQWKKNGVAILGATTSTYTTASLSNSDAITCVMTPSLSCVTATTVTSNTITMSVSNSFAVDGIYYSITSFDNKTVYVTYINDNYDSYFGYNGYSGNVIIPSTVSYNGITYAVTSIGDNAFYNSSSLTSVSIPSSITFIGSYAFYNCSGLTSIHANSATPVSITLGSSVFSRVSTSICKLYVPTGSGDLYGSASQWSAFTTRLTENLTPSVSINASATTVCSGTSVTFTATPSNGGTAPTYQWKKNGVVVSGAIGSTYSTTAFADKDTLSCELTSNLSYVTTKTASSNLIMMSVIVGSVTPAVSVSAKDTTICSGTSVTFTAIPVNGGSTPGYQWKCNGNIISGATGNTYTTSSLSNNDSINCVMTSGLSCASPAIATSNYVKVSVGPYTPSVIIGATTTAICSGTSVTFTATPVNGGSNPSYQWTKNGIYIYGATKSTYTTASFNDKDSVSCVMTSNMSCVTTTTATSKSIKMSVIKGTVTPSVAISATATSICSGTAVTFTAVPTYGGSNPSFQWKRNGVEISGATNSTYTTTSLSDKDSISCILTSNLSCVTSATAVSNAIKMSVGTFTPSVIINASATTICSGTSVTFTATQVNGGTKPSYQWRKNGTAISGATSSTYTTTTLNDKDSVSCVLTSTLPCVTSSTVSSNGIRISVVTGPVTPAVSISATATAICSGVAVTFSATSTNGGSNPIYQWKKNGVVISGANSSIYITSLLNDKDSINCVLTSSLSCATTPSVKSNTLKMTVVSLPILSITQPTIAVPTGTISVSPIHSRFSYSIDGVKYQDSNVFAQLPIGNYTITIKDAIGTISQVALAVINASSIVSSDQNYQIVSTNLTCNGSNNGSIHITTLSSQKYTVTITGGSYKKSDSFTGTSYGVSDLSAGTYTVSLGVDNLSNYQQCFNVVISQPKSLSVLKISALNSSVKYLVNGSSDYYVARNDTTIKTQSEYVEIPLQAGVNKIKIYTDKLCQGVYEESIYLDKNKQIVLYPNPTTGKVAVGISGQDKEIIVQISSLSGAVLYRNKLSIDSSRLVNVDISNFKNGTYIFQLYGKTTSEAIRVVKQ